MEPSLPQTVENAQRDPGGQPSGMAAWLRDEMSRLAARKAELDDQLAAAEAAIAEADVIRRHVMFHPERFTPSERDSVTEKAQQLAGTRGQALAGVLGAEEQMQLCEALMAALEVAVESSPALASAAPAADDVAAARAEEAAAEAAQRAAQAASEQVAAAVAAAMAGAEQDKDKALAAAKTAASEELLIAVEAARNAAEAEFTARLHEAEARFSEALAQAEHAPPGRSEGASPAMALRILQAVESERLRIARDLHDGPAQLLADIALRAEILERVGRHSPDSLPAEVAEFKAIVKNAVDDIRRFMFDLRPDSLDDLGLVATMKRYSQEFQERTGTTTRFNIIGDERRLDPELEESLFRVIQEALTNVHRHADAQSVEITYTVNGESASLRIKDDGQGFDATVGAGSTRLGLVGMRERIEALGGEFSLQSSAGRGTEISVRVPPSRSA